MHRVLKFGEDWAIDIIAAELIAGGVVALLSSEQVELNRWVKDLEDVPHLLANPMQDLCMALWHWLHL